MPTGFRKAGKVEVAFRIGDILNRFEDTANLLVTHELEKIADLAVQETEAIIRKEFVNDRNSRRRKQGAQHLLGSIRSNVLHSGKTAQLIVWSTASPGKVGMLEEGTSKTYTIHPRDIENGFLFFPSNQSGRPSAGVSPGVRDTSRRNVAFQSFHRKGGLGKGGDLMTKTFSAEHGPYTGKHFMRKGTQAAIRKGLGRS